jgi:hypothetical protein
MTALTSGSAKRMKAMLRIDLLLNLSVAIETPIGINPRSKGRVAFCTTRDSLYIGVVMGQVSWADESTGQQ